MSDTDKKIHSFLYDKKHSVFFYKIAQKIEDTFFNPECDYSGHGGDIAHRNTTFHKYHHDYKGTSNAIKMLLMAPCFMLFVVELLVFIFFLTQVIH